MKKTFFLAISFFICLTSTSCGHNHQISEKWFSDEENHYHSCEKCNERINNESHVFGEWSVIKSASETESGSEKRICTICDYEQIEITPQLTHVHSYGNWIIDSTKHYKECSCKNKTEENNHTFSSWTIITPSTETNEGSKKRTCTVCLYEEFIEIPKLNSEMNKYIDKLILDTDSYIPSWNQESFKGRWNYIDGVFLNSIVSLYYSYKDTDEIKANNYKQFLIRYVNYYVNENGEFINPETQSNGFKNDELDSICESKILFDLYEMTKDERYIKAIQITYESLISQSRVEGSNNFSHKEIYLNQIWLDGMYMYGPFYARYALSTGNNNIFDELKNQYQYIREHMFNEETKLYYHGYDSTKSIFWADPETGCSESFWLRSMGWYLVSLCDVIEYYPDGSNKEYLKGLLIEAVDGIMQYQDVETKLFYQVIDKGNTSIYVSGDYLVGLKNDAYEKDGAIISNYLETSGSSMIAYTLLKGSKLGYLDSSYLNKGKEVYEGIYQYSFDGTELSNICITAGLGPDNRKYRDGSMAYYLAEPVGSNDAKGVGPFIMSYIEYQYDMVNISTPKIE